jgi:hypothetical protein
MFIAGDSLNKSLVHSPRAKHCLQTESIWVLHILIQSRAECPVTQKNQSDLFHEAEKVEVVFRRDFATFIWIPPSAIAEGSCSLPTMSGIEAEATGAWNAKPVPSKKTAARMTVGVRPPRKAQQASKPALPASQPFEMRSSLRRSARSASAPAGKVNRKNGNAAADDIKESKRTDPPSKFIAQVAAISCAEMQQPDTTRADQTRR